MLLMYLSFLNFLHLTPRRLGVWRYWTSRRTSFIIPVTARPMSPEELPRRLTYGNLLSDGSGQFVNLGNKKHPLRSLNSLS